MNTDMDFDDDIDYDDLEEVIELPHTPSVLERRICDLEDNVSELLRAVADALEVIETAADELRETINTFESPPEE